MCGICGFISKKSITIDQLKQMNNTMYHRGPNDSGEEIFAAKGGYEVGLARGVFPFWICPCLVINQCILVMIDW